MFSKRFYIIIWTCLYLGHLIGAFPFRFSWHKKQFIYSKHAAYLYKFTVVLVAILQIFMAVQTLRFRLQGKTEWFNISYAFNIGSGVILTSFLVTSLSQKQLLATMNGFLEFINRIYRKIVSRQLCKKYSNKN